MLKYKKYKHEEKTRVQNIIFKIPYGVRNYNTRQLRYTFKHYNLHDTYLRIQRHRGKA